MAGRTVFNLKRTNYTEYIYTEPTHSLQTAHLLLFAGHLKTSITLLAYFEVAYICVSENKCLHWKIFPSWKFSVILASLWGWLKSQQSVCFNILTLCTIGNKNPAYSIWSLAYLVLPEFQSAVTSSYSGLEMMLNLTQRRFLEQTCACPLWEPIFEAPITNESKLHLLTFSAVPGTQP